MPTSEIRSAECRATLLKSVCFVTSLMPLLWLVGIVLADAAGANPVEAVTRGLGDWALRFLLLTLAVTPLRRWLQWPVLMRLRRQLGLFSFAYACLHVLAYLWADQFFDWMAIWNDVLKRPFITIGAVAFALMIPLALTSSQMAIRRLGGRRWQALHRIVYVLAIAAVIHYWWMVKVDIREPAVYSAVLAVLLGARVRWWWQSLMATRSPGPVCKR